MPWLSGFEPWPSWLSKVVSIGQLSQVIRLGRGQPVGGVLLESFLEDRHQAPSRPGLNLSSLATQRIGASLEVVCEDREVPWLPCYEPWPS